MSDLLNETKTQKDSLVVPSFLGNSLKKPKKKAPQVNLCYISCLVLTLTIGMFQFGFCLASWNYFYVSFKIRLGEEQWQPWYLWGFTGFTVLGAMISSIGTGYLMPFGKWKLFHLNNLLLICASSLSLIECIPLQMACRFFYGMAAGAFTVMVPKFINETAPQELKGPYGALSQISITVGIFVCALLGLPVPEDPEDWENVTNDSFWVQNYWRVVWSIPIFLALLQSTLLFLVFKYDTPFKLKKMGQFQELEELMNKIYNAEFVSERIDAIDVREIVGMEFVIQIRVPTMTETFCEPAIRRAHWVGCTVSVIQQMTGVNSIIFYSTYIFTNVADARISGNVASVIIAGVNMVTAIIALVLLNYYGRRTLLIITLGLASIFLALEGIFNSIEDGNAALTMCLLFIAVFEFGPGPIAWIYMSEVMNEKGVAMGTFINWFLTFLFAVCTPGLMEQFPSAAFYGFSCCCALSLIFTVIFVKETKGLNDTELQLLYRKDRQEILDREEMMRASDRSSQLSSNSRNTFLKSKKDGSEWSDLDQ